MIFANFWFLKQKNGMYFYGLEYVDGLHKMGSNMTVLVKPELMPMDELDARINIIQLTTVGFIFFVMKAIILRYAIYSPTLHAIPFVRRQVTTLHDIYPFQKAVLSGKLKYLVFRAMHLLSFGRICAINRVVEKSFLSDMGARTFFAPNRFNPHPERVNQPAIISKKISVGLVGTDTTKKNYDELFSLIDEKFQGLQFRIYGNETKYLNSILERFRHLSIEFVSSENVSLACFLQKETDVIVSVAKFEGFCRPIALALSIGVPCILIEDDVFEEFYKDIAIFRPSASEILLLLRQPELWNNSVDRSIISKRAKSWNAAYEKSCSEIYRYLK